MRSVQGRGASRVVASVFVWVVLFSLIDVLSTVAAVTYNDCPQTTIDTILCPGITEQKCGNVVKKKINIPVIPNLPGIPPELTAINGAEVPWCENYTWRQPQMGSFGTKLNRPNETETQTDPDEEDEVDCYKSGWCLLKVTTNICEQVAAKAFNANPQEEVNCKPDGSGS